MKANWLKRVVPRLAVLVVILAALVVPLFASTPVLAAGSLYLKATGNWDDANTWSATDGGAAGAGVPDAATDVFITANGNGLTLTVNVAAAAKSFTCSGANTATLAGAQTITVGGNVALLASMTVPNTITWTVTGTGNFAGSTLATLGAINLNGTAHTLSGAFTNTVLTRNGTATKTDTLTLTSGTTLTCTTFAMIGNSATNRLLVQSSTLGTAATVTATNWTGTVNVDIMDVTATNAIDLSAITGGSGDCGGNTGITFTTAAAQISNTTGNWSTLATWQDGVGTDRVPLPQDDVSCSHNVTVDMPRIGKSITFTGTPTVTLGNSISVYGSLTFASGMTYTVGSYENYFKGRGSYTFTSAGKIPNRILLEAPTGTLTLSDDLTLQAVYAVVLTNGTLDISNRTVTCTTTTAGIKFDVRAGTIVTTGSTIVLTNSGANAQTFNGLGKTYNNLTIQGAGNYALTISGSNTFNTVRVDASQAAKTVKFTDTTTQTVSDFKRDNGTNNIFLQGTAAAGWAMTATVGDNISLDYLQITNSTVLPVNTWYAGGNSNDIAGNVNWLFTDPNLTMTTGAITGLTIDRDGVSAGTANMTTAPTLRGSPRIPNQIEYGLTNAYGATTALTTLYGTGATTAALPATLLPNTLYHWRASATNDAGTFVGADATFTIAPPTVSTVSATNTGTAVTLNGNVTSLGDASSVYIYAEYGTTNAYGNVTAPGIMASTGAFSFNVTHPDYPRDLHYRVAVVVGTSTYYGVDKVLSTATAAKEFNLDQILQVVPLLVFVLALMAAGVLSVWGWKKGNIIMVAIGLIFVAVMIIIYPIIIAGVEGILAFIP